jgi:hypothetical protein
MDHETWQALFLAAFLLVGLWLLRRLYHAWMAALPTISYYARMGVIAGLLVGAFALGVDMRGAA